MQQMVWTWGWLKFLIKTKQFSTASDPRNLCENSINNLHFSNWCDFDHLLNPKFHLPNWLKKSSQHSSYWSPQSGNRVPRVSHMEHYHITWDNMVRNVSNRSGGQRSHLLDTCGRELDVHGEDSDILALLHLGDREPISSATAVAPSTAAAR